jgi:hypothetical protein
MAKMERERNVKEKRAKKQERKEEKKAMREAGIDPMAEFQSESPTAEDETPVAEEETPVER